MARFLNRTKAAALSVLAAGAVTGLSGCDEDKAPPGTPDHNNNNPERCQVAPDLPGCNQSNVGGVNLAEHVKTAPTMKM